MGNGGNGGTGGNGGFAVSGNNIHINNYGYITGGGGGGGGNGGRPGENYDTGITADGGNGGNGGNGGAAISGSNITINNYGSIRPGRGGMGGMGTTLISPEAIQVTEDRMVIQQYY